MEVFLVSHSKNNLQLPQIAPKRKLLYAAGIQLQGSHSAELRNERDGAGFSSVLEQVPKRSVRFFFN